MKSESVFCSNEKAAIDAELKKLIEFTLQMENELDLVLQENKSK